MKKLNLLLLLSVPIVSVASRIHHATTTKAFRGAILHFLQDPWQLERDNKCSGQQCDEMASEYFEDGALLLGSDGKVITVGDFNEISNQFQIDTVEVMPKDTLITPGFIDCHVHAPQIDSRLYQRRRLGVAIDMVC